MIVIYCISLSRDYNCARRPVVHSQEPGSDAEIKEFAKGFDAKFDLFSKIEVNGDGAHPLWKWMKAQPKGKGLLGK